jgi:hypothetical protein
MHNKAPAIISAILTVLFLVVIAILLLVGQLLALNGFSERQGTVSLVTSLVCQGTSVVLAAVLASRLTQAFIEKFNWNKAVAVIVAVVAGIFPGTVLMSLGFFVSVLIAEGLR